MCRGAHCSKPSYRSDFCFRHNNIIKDAPPAVRWAVLNADLAGDLVPCDMIDFLIKEEVVFRHRRDLAASIMLALLKEPTATDEFVKQWQNFPADYSGGHLHAGLKAVVEVCCASTPDQEVPHAAELQQLSRRGVARFLGTTAVASGFGVVRKAAEDEVGFCLGLTRQRYKWAGGEPIVSTKFLESVRTLSEREAKSLFPPCFDAGAERTVSDLVAFSFSFRSVLEEVGDHVPTLHLRGQYVRDSVVRKHVVARQSCATGWGCAIPTLHSLFVDRGAFLECFDASVTAADASVLVCGRPHWATFVSMFTCLWKEVADTIPEAEAVIEKARRSGQAHTTIKEFQSEHGFSPHPHTFVTRLCGVE